MDALIERIAELTSRLVEIDSVNPSLVPGAAGERQIALFIADWLRGRGLDTSVDEVEPGRFTVIAVARGTGGGRSLMLNGHMDTVGVGGMAEPFRPRREGYRLHGRGAFDMKTSLAAMMLAGEQAAAAPRPGDLILAFVCDEEYASIGTARVAERMWADAAIVTEPTGLDLCIAHKGFAWLEIETRGVAAHGSLAAEGVDAIAAMGPVLCGIAELQADLDRGPRHPLLGAPSVHASLISGGTELSTYPDRCTLSVERRTVPGESDALIEAEFTALLERAGRNVPHFSAALEMGVTRQPFEIAPDHPFVQLVIAAAAASGREPGLTGAFGWMDSALLAAAGIPTVIFGPHGEGAHADEEWVDLASAAAALRTLDEVAARFCG